VSDNKSERRDRERFERDYRDWILLMAKDAACRLSAMPLRKRLHVLMNYEDFRDPRVVFRKLFDPNRIARLAGDRISHYIVIETDAITFFPSIYSGFSGALDFAVAMNRRFFCGGQWYPLIALNHEYVSQSSDRILTFALDHEFEMSRIYHEISLNMRCLSWDEKRDVVDRAQQISSERLKITQDELFEDERLMHKLSFSQPLIPKPYAERAMLIYLEENLSELEVYGLPSISPEEYVFGEELYSEFRGWSEFSQSSYDLFIREIIANLRDINKGYS
jgi:hypothetical protein